MNARLSMRHARGYRWNEDGGPNPKAWYIDVDDNTKEQELAFLRWEIYQRDVELRVRKITVFERSFDRIWRSSMTPRCAAADRVGNGRSDR